MIATAAAATRRGASMLFLVLSMASAAAVSMVYVRACVPTH